MPIALEQINIQLIEKGFFKIGRNRCSTRISTLKTKSQVWAWRSQEALEPLRKYILHDMTMHIGQAVPPALVLVGQAFVVDAK